MDAPAKLKGFHPIYQNRLDGVRVLHPDWKSALKADSTDWLQEPDKPLVRHYALTDLFDRSLDDREVIEARSTLPNWARVDVAEGWAIRFGPGLIARPHPLWTRLHLGLLLQSRQGEVSC